MNETKRSYFVVMCVWSGLLAFALVYSLIEPVARMFKDNSIIRVGSKAFTESVVLGEVLAHLARNTGADVRHRASLGGTQIVWKALLNGDIDAYVDYTGTIRGEILSEYKKKGIELPTDADLRNALAKKHVVMSDHVGFINTYALGLRRPLAENLNIQKISDLNKRPDLKFGLSDEFIERDDGWYKLAEHYKLKHKKIRNMDHNLAYRGLTSDAIQVTDIFTTDAEIKQHDLRVLDDDKTFFPKYYAVILMRDDLAIRAPEVAKAMLKLESLIDQEEMKVLSASSYST